MSFIRLEKEKSREAKTGEFAGEWVRDIGRG
jgi:hypothetical protein